MLNPMLRPDMGNHPYGGPGGSPIHPEDDPEMAMKYFHKSSVYDIVIAMHIFLVVVALASNLLIHAVMLLGKARAQLNTPFFEIVHTLMIFTTVKALVQAIFIIPQYIDKSNMYNQGYVTTMFVLDVLADYGILLMSTIIALNRFSIFVCPQISRIFEKPYIRILKGLCILLALVCSLVINLTGCSRTYDKTTNTFYDNCVNKDGEINKTNITTTIFLDFFYALCIANFILYVVMYARIRLQRRSISMAPPVLGGGHEDGGSSSSCCNNKPELAVLRQAIVTLCLYSASVLLCAILPYINVDVFFFFLLMYASNVISLLISMAFPLFFLLSTKEMRRIVRGWLSHLPFSSFRRPSTIVTKTLESSSGEEKERVGEGGGGEERLGTLQRSKDSKRAFSA